MPHINPYKCYEQQPQRLAITIPETLPAHWLKDFYGLLTMQLQLDNKNAVFEDVDYTRIETILLTAQEKFFKKLDQHIGEVSTYTFKSKLLESLSKLFAVFTHADTTNEQKNLIAGGIAEDVYECTPGFHDRVNFIITRLNLPQNLDELLAQLRFNLVDKIAHQLADKSAQGVHVHARMHKLAQIAGFGVWNINEKDTYERTGSSNISDEAIIQKVQEGFHRHYQCFAIINALCEEIKVLIAPLGYDGKRQPGKEYPNGWDDKFLACLTLFTFIDQRMAFERNADKVSDINWQYVKTAFFQKLRNEGYITLSNEETALLDGLLPWDANSVYQLIPNAYELAEFLQFFSQWSKEQKACFVLAYLQTKLPNEQKEILTILDNEVRQLTSELKTQASLQAMYFAIAISDKDINAMRTYIEHGENINAALALLFSENHKRDTFYWLREHPELLKSVTATGMSTVMCQGKYQGKTIAETWVSTKKGRQLLLENETLQTLLQETTIANKLPDLLKQAQTEKNIVNTTVGFFKQFDPLAIQLSEYIVYGDLTKSENLLKAHPHLVRTLLTEQVTVKDYSRRKVKQKTPLQAALCAMDDELCAMLAQYMTFDDINAQYQAIFPQGHQAYYKAQTAFNFTQITDIISLSSAADVEKALSLELPNDTPLWAALEQFRTEFTQRSYQETVFNPKHLIEAVYLYDINYDIWSNNQQKLFWCQVVGYVQRFLPANIAMDFAQGLYNLVENKVKSKRSFNFTYGGGAIFPLVFDSLSGLGYKDAASIRGWRGWGEGGMHVLVPLCVSQLMSSKKSNLGRIMQGHHSSWCLIQ